MPQGNGQQQQDLEIDPTKDILIKYNHATRSIRLMAPLADKIYCLGILELAKQAVQNFNPEQASPIAAAPASALNALPAPDFQTGRRA